MVGRSSAKAKFLHRGQKVFVPDFVFRHSDGRTVLIEIVGFWTPEYLQAEAGNVADVSGLARTIGGRRSRPGGDGEK